MYLEFRNVNTAFAFFYQHFDWDREAIARESRYGPVRYIPEPVTIKYERPTERVLFARPEANPFFFLYESFWMLAGRQDVASLTRYAKKMAEFSDDGIHFHGAYGYRWRKHFDLDQLQMIVEELTVDPNSRRCVLQIWDAVTDAGLGIETKDKPCNTQVYFALTHDGALDMTVCNRSNDLVWGMFGANAVHFSYLQEYIACGLNVPVGSYYQISNNLHIYDATWTPEKWDHSTAYVAYPPHPKLDASDEEIHAIADHAWDYPYQSEYIKGTVLPMMEAWRDKTYYPVASEDWDFVLKRKAERWV